MALNQIHPRWLTDFTKTLNQHQAFNNVKSNLGFKKVEKMLQLVWNKINILYIDQLGTLENENDDEFIWLESWLAFPNAYILSKCQNDFYKSNISLNTMNFSVTHPQFFRSSCQENVHFLLTLYLWKLNE